MNNKSLILSFLTFSIIFSFSVFADTAFPCAIHGTAKLGDNYVNGTYVTAYLNSTEGYLATADEASEPENYTIEVFAVGDYVKFKIAGIWVNELAVLCVDHPSIRLDLTAATLSDGSTCEYDIACSSGHCVNGFCQTIGDGSCGIGENCSNSPNDCACQPPNQMYCDANGVCQQYCGDHICDNGETCATCSIDCGGCSGPLPSGGGGGGGTFITCKENWTCTDWSGCVNGLQTRTCTDLNKCNTIKNKPNETQSCVVQTPQTPCIEDWSCADWSDCINNQQTRTCTDLKNCGTTVDKPIESRDCIVTTPPAITGLFLGLTTMDWATAIAAGIIIAIILIVLFRKRKSKK